MMGKRFLAGILTFAMAMSCAVLPKTDSHAAVKISKKTITLQVGKKTTLKLKKAKGSITWKSANNAIATVSKKGVVKAIHSGVTTISAKNKKKTYKCTVTVKSSSAKKAINSLLLNSTFLYTSESSKLKKYKTKAANRKKEILNSPTSITKSSTFIRGETYTGTAYYVSEKHGNDDNDGLSPETAWQTIDRVGWQDLLSGDAVFFERGGTYILRDNPLVAKTDVTYSAYGTGDKPIITMVQENSASTDRWTLYYEKGSKKNMEI